VNATRRRGGVLCRQECAAAGSACWDEIVLCVYSFDTVVKFSHETDGNPARLALLPRWLSIERVQLCTFYPVLY